MAEKGLFSEFELAEDVKKFVTMNKDVSVDSKIKDKLYSFDDAVLLKVTKVIASPTQILSIEQVDDEYIKKNF